MFFRQFVVIKSFLYFVNNKMCKYVDLENKNICLIVKLVCVDYQSQFAIIFLIMILATSLLLGQNLKVPRTHPELFVLC